jgi:hypothetical protein
VDKILLAERPRVAHVRDFLLNRLINQTLPGFSSPSQQKSWFVSERELAERVLAAEDQYLLLAVGAFLQEEGL